MEQLMNVKTFIQLQVKEKEKRINEIEKKYEDKFNKAISEKVCKGMKMFYLLMDSQNDMLEYNQVHASIMSLEKVLDYVCDEITKLNNIK